jgi:hypothetical protein
MTLSEQIYKFKTPAPPRQAPTPAVQPIPRQPLTADERFMWDERVAICMVDGKVSQADAERIAWQQVEQARQAKPPTVLKHCRCQDCRRLRDGQCAVGIMVAGDYPPNAWHYCAEYLGPAISPDTFVWRYDDPPVSQQAAHVGPRAETAGEATKEATAAHGTPRRQR